ncbi:hypothetical protein F8388_004270 [Cannabis sativa]|uniref:Uncharacterized protein n=1 Tax=Cannabis sativa TaxID=3483 RepID=A0A7J6F7G8_CANSA|nr:hypothetical protein F8388_004270 [Cannabis sativa]
MKQIVRLISYKDKRVNCTLLCRCISLFSPRLQLSSCLAHKERRKREGSGDLVQTLNSKFHSNLNSPSSISVNCDVTHSRNLSAAFDKHVETYGGLDICITSAGIGTQIPFHKDQSDDNSTWRKVVFCYALSANDGSEWRVRIQSDMIARMINEDKIQILVNLNNYTKINNSEEDFEKANGRLKDIYCKLFSLIYH